MDRAEHRDHVGIIVRGARMTGALQPPHATASWLGPDDAGDANKEAGRQIAAAMEQAVLSWIRAGVRALTPTVTEAIEGASAKPHPDS